MGKLEERSDGYYVLENVKVGMITIPTKVFQEVEKSSEEVSKLRRSDGFYLDIPDKLDIFDKE